MPGTRRWVLVALAVTALAVAFAADLWTYHHVRFAAVYDQDWGRALRSVGYWPLWIAMSIALWLNDRDRRRAVRLAGAVTAAGLLDEVLKIVARRERPGLHDGAYAFRAWSPHPFDTRGLGMPSSHAMVAFAGAAALGVMFPRTRCVWYALAVGCAVTRLLAGAHFLSDVVVGAIVGAAVGATIAKA